MNRLHSPRCTTLMDPVRACVASIRQTSGGSEEADRCMLRLRSSGPIVPDRPERRLCAAIAPKAQRASGARGEWRGSAARRTISSSSPFPGCYCFLTGRGKPRNCLRRLNCSRTVRNSRQPALARTQPGTTHSGQYRPTRHRPVLARNHHRDWTICTLPSYPGGQPKHGCVPMWSMGTQTRRV